MPSNDPPAITFEFVDQHSRRRRVRFVQQDPGGWVRVQEQKDGDEWRPLGTESAVALEVSVDAAATDVVAIVPPGDVVDEPIGETVNDPEVTTR